MQKEALKLVFADKKYLALAISIFSGLLVLLSILSGFVFFTPHLLFYVPTELITNFSLAVVVSALSGLVVSLSVYRLILMNSGVKKSGLGFFGSIIGASAGACSCGPVGFAAVSAFGAVGASATSFVTNYEIPIRLIAIAILMYAYFTSIKGISNQCKIIK